MLCDTQKKATEDKNSVAEYGNWQYLEYILAAFGPQRLDFPHQDVVVRLYVFDG